jgi:Glycosyl transferase family 2
MSLVNLSNTPLVSIIIPTYNRPTYLREAIGSAIHQTYQNIEVIVSDDCSPNNPEGLINSFQDSRIIFYRQPSNLGMFTNTISGFQRARGKYVVSLNDDNLLNSDFVEKLLPYLEDNSDLVMAFCDHFIIDENSEIDLSETEKSTQKWKRNQLSRGICQPFWKQGLVDGAVPTSVSALIRREAIDWNAFPEGAGVFWDLYTTYLACCSGRGAYYLPEKLAQYRVHSQSETAISGKEDATAKHRKASADIFCHYTFLNDSRLEEFKPIFERRWAHANVTMGIALLKLGAGAEGAKYSED